MHLKMFNNLNKNLPILLSYKKSNTSGTVWLPSNTTILFLFSFMLPSHVLAYLSCLQETGCDSVGQM
jgi:hypothetical protein